MVAREVRDERCDAHLHEAWATGVAVTMWIEVVAGPKLRNSEQAAARRTVEQSWPPARPMIHRVK